MELTFPHRVFYVEGTTSIEEVIANLQAQKRLIEEGVNLLDQLVEGLTVEKVDIRVVAIREGSFLTEFVILVYGAYQREIQEMVAGNIEKMFGTDIPDHLEPLVTLVTLAVIYFVARYAYDAVRGRRREGSEARPVHIEGDYNTVINVIARDLNVPVTDIEDALHEAVPRAKRRSLVKQVARFLRPSRDGRVSPIEVKGFGEIKPETIAEFPSDADLEAIDESRNIDVPDACLNIRATDKDKHKKWAAVVIGDKRFRRRLPMELYPTIDAEAVAKLDVVRGDIIVEGDRDASGAFKPKRIHLLAIKPDVEPEP